MRLGRAEMGCGGRTGEIGGAVWIMGRDGFCSWTSRGLVSPMSELGDEGGTRGVARPLSSGSGEVEENDNLGMIPLSMIFNVLKL